MDVVAFTRQLVDIESITGNEGPVGDFLRGELNRLGYEAKKMRVEGERCNVYATTTQQPRPAIVFSTHMDTVPPFIRSSEDERRVYGRGSCDAKGIIAAQVAAAETLGCFSSLAKNVTALVRKLPTNKLTDASFSSTASPPKIGWQLPRKAPCVLN